MSKTLTTNLQHFRYNIDEQHELFKVEWFYFDPEEVTARGFSEDELNLFIDYVVTNQINFVGGKNYHELPDDFETVSLEVDSFSEEEKLTSPQYIVLTSMPRVNSRNELDFIMDILLLTNQGLPVHSYDLPFYVVGKLVY